MLNLIHTEEADQAVSASATIDANQVRTDGGTQMRAQLDLETVEEYRQAMKEAGGWGSFPALIVFYDGETHWLGDGFHRHAAYQSLPFDDPTPADIRAGTRQDAILHAAGANAKHGLRRTHADKRRAVATLLASDDWSTWSDRQIAKACNVSPTFVGKIRSTQPPAGEASEDVNEDGHTVHVDSMKSERTFVHPKSGKTTTMNTCNIGKASALLTKEDGFHKVVEPQPLTSAEIVSIAPDTLPEWAAPDSLTITINADTASALILAYDKNRIPRGLTGIDEFINDLTDACNRQIHQPQAESPTPLPPVDMDWRAGWDQADEDEYDSINSVWDIDEVTLPRVAMRMAEEESDPELAGLLYSKLDELTGEPDV